MVLKYSSEGAVARRLNVEVAKIPLYAGCREYAGIMKARQEIHWQSGTEQGTSIGAVERSVSVSQQAGGISS